MRTLVWQKQLLSKDGHVSVAGIELSVLQRLTFLKQFLGCDKASLDNSDVVQCHCRDLSVYARWEFGLRGSNFMGKMVAHCSSATFAANLALNLHFLIDVRCTICQLNLYFQKAVMDVELKWAVEVERAASHYVAFLESRNTSWLIKSCFWPSSRHKPASFAIYQIWRCQI